MKNNFFRRLRTFGQLLDMPQMRFELGTLVCKHRMVNFFLKIRECGFPCDSNYTATKRKVCLGLGTDI